MSTGGSRLPPATGQAGRSKPDLGGRDLEGYFRYVLSASEIHHKCYIWLELDQAGHVRIQALESDSFGVLEGGQTATHHPREAKKWLRQAPLGHAYQQKGGCSSTPR